jgi:hypothetical protein
LIAAQFKRGTRFRHRDAIELIAVLIFFIAFHLLFLFVIATRFLGFRCCVCGPLTFVPSDIQQLFSNCVFWGKAALYVRLKESLIRNAALQHIGVMLLVQALKPFERDGVGSPLAAGSNGRREPSLFNPENDLRFSNA